MEGLDTIADFVRWGASRFNEAGLHYGHGTDNAIDESLLLVLHALHLEQPLPGEFYHSRITPSEKDDIERLFRRRIRERLPAAYIVGEAWFCGMKFKVNENVLVPRSPIAEMIENGFAPWVSSDGIGSVLDLCTGSGCIAISSAACLPGCDVVASDVSQDALSVARDNIDRYGLADRVTLVKSDVFDALGDRRFDVIVSNPPYVAKDEFRELPEEYGHEPGLGLVAGDDGLDIVRRIIAGARGHLNDNGLLVVEVGSAADALVSAFPDLPFAWPEFKRGGGGIFVLTADQLETGRVHSVG